MPQKNLALSVSREGSLAGQIQLLMRNLQGMAKPVGERVAAPLPVSSSQQPVTHKLG
jgi:hypothetical protein